MFEQIRSFFENLNLNAVMGPEMEVAGFDVRFVLALAIFIGALIAFEGIRQFLRRGENRGRKIAYYNVVRKMLPVGMWYGKSFVRRKTHITKLPKHTPQFCYTHQLSTRNT